MLAGGIRLVKPSASCTDFAPHCWSDYNLLVPRLSDLLFKDNIILFILNCKVKLCGVQEILYTLDIKNTSG